METGKVHGIVGLNGAGKSSLLNCIYGYIKPGNGSILSGLHPVNRRQIGYLEATNYFYPNITGKEYLALFRAGNSSFDMEIWQKLFALPLNQEVSYYSTGMKKKIALLAILKLDKEIIILDEPYNGLDIETSYLLSLIISQLRKKGKTVIITSHIYETLTESCDYIHYLSGGKIEQSYPKEKFEELHTKLHQQIETKIGNWIEEAL